MRLPNPPATISINEVLPRAVLSGLKIRTHKKTTLKTTGKEIKTHL